MPRTFVITRLCLCRTLLHHCLPISVFHLSQLLQHFRILCSQTFTCPAPTALGHMVTIVDLDEEDVELPQASGRTERPSLLASRPKSRAKQQPLLAPSSKSRAKRLPTPPPAPAVLEEPYRHASKSAKRRNRAKLLKSAYEAGRGAAEEEDTEQMAQSPLTQTYAGKPLVKPQYYDETKYWFQGVVSISSLPVYDDRPYSGRRVGTLRRGSATGLLFDFTLSSDNLLISARRVDDTWVNVWCATNKFNRKGDAVFVQVASELWSHGVPPRSLDPAGVYQQPPHPAKVAAAQGRAVDRREHMSGVADDDDDDVPHPDAAGSGYRPGDDVAAVEQVRLVSRKRTPSTETVRLTSVRKKPPLTLASRSHVVRRKEQSAREDPRPPLKRRRKTHTAPVVKRSASTSSSATASETSAVPPADEPGTWVEAQKRRNTSFLTKSLRRRARQALRPPPGLKKHEGFMTQFLINRIARDSKTLRQLKDRSSVVFRDTMASGYVEEGLERDPFALVKREKMASPVRPASKRR